MPARAALFGILGICCLVANGCTTETDRTCKGTRVEYPESPRGEQIDTYHDVEVEDPYRWLEELETPAVAAWVDAQNELSITYLESLPQRESIQARLTEVWNFERYGTPFKEGGRYFYTYNDGLQNQSVLLVTEDPAEEPRLLLDPNTLSDDGTIALTSYRVSPDGLKLAYGVSDGGTDWKTWRIRDIERTEDLADEILFTKFTVPSWSADSGGFYYSRYPLKEDGTGDGSAAISVYYHRLGDEQEEDELIYEIPGQPRWQPDAEVTEGGRFLVITIREGSFANLVSIRDLLQPNSKILPVFEGWNALYELVGSLGTKLYFLTNEDAPNGRIIEVDGTHPDSYREIIPEAPERLESTSLVGGHLLTRYLKDAASQVKVFDLRGALIRELELPGIGTAGGFRGLASDPDTFYSFSSFTSPPQILLYNVGTGASELFRKPDVDADLENFETHQIFYESQDGTRVPMFITHRSGLELDGSNPTLLFGYGGFDISLTPSFRPDRLVWLEMGGVLAIPNLRGGGEYGERWHRAGTKLQKQNVFDDFIAAAEFLIAEGYTSTAKLAIQGGSNGGLLVGAVLNQRPDLFAAALPAVGVMDMLRYHLPSSNARAWSSDYGLSENEEEFAALYAYSPYHNIVAGECYPPTLVTTADRDDRVVPWHSFKYGAALQLAQGCTNPILVRVETRAGHGAGKPTWMQIEEVADRWAFLASALDMDVDLAK